MMRGLACAILLAAPALAHAERDVAIATNVPARWADGSVGLSGWLQVADDQAVRANVASYTYGPDTAATLYGFLAHGAEGFEGSYRGRVTDAGLSYVLFPSGFCRGFMLELGALVRVRETSVQDDPESQTLAVDTTTLAGRLMVGWHWAIGKHVFISLAVGVSGGWERGTETTLPAPLSSAMPTTTDVARETFEPEGILRVGGKLGR